jgi:hypothetical protein
MTLDKTTRAIIYPGLLFGIPMVLAIVAVKLTWRGVSSTAQKAGSFGLLLCRPFVVIRHRKQSSVRG